MQKSTLLYSFILSFAVATTACGRNTTSVSVASAAPAEATEESTQNQSLSTTLQSFTTVEGPNLMARLEAASQRARSSQSPYWSAYSFDVRPGVAIDPGS